MLDKQGREYAKLSTLKPGDKVQVDGGFEGCFLPWSTLEVVRVNDRLALYHNAPECGACGGSDGGCPHFLDGQEAGDGSLIGVYPTTTP